MIHRKYDITIKHSEKSQDLHEISLNELDEINELSASSQNLSITLEKPEIPIRRDVYPDRKTEIDKSRLYNPSSKADFINKGTDNLLSTSIFNLEFTLLSRSDI